MCQTEFIKKKKKRKKKEKESEMFFCSSGFWDRFPLFSHVQFGGEGWGDRELIFRPVSRKRVYLCL